MDIVSLEDARRQLRLGSDTSRDQELLDWITDAQDWIEDYTGHTLSLRDVTRYEQTDAGRALCLAAERVRGAAEDRNALFAEPSRPTASGGGPVPPIPADDPG